MMMRKEEGFTLVELLIVIAIIGVLAMVAVPRFMDMQSDSVIKACLANQGTLETAIEQYASLTATLGTYPGKQKDLIDSKILKRYVYCPGNNASSATHTGGTGGDGDYTWSTTGAVSCAYNNTKHIQN